MKKTILNSYVEIIVVGICESFFVFALILSFISTPLIKNRIIYASVWGVFIIMGLMLLLHCFEMLIINENTITSIKAFRKTRIIIKEIDNVQEKEVKLNCFCGEFGMAWEIVDSKSNVIYIVKKKRRQKIIDYIQKINS